MRCSKTSEEKIIEELKSILNFDETAIFYEEIYVYDGGKWIMDKGIGISERDLKRSGNQKQLLKRIREIARKYHAKLRKLHSYDYGMLLYLDLNEGERS